MENGFVILGIIALLFFSMYGFSYFSVAREKMNQKKNQQKEIQKDRLRRQTRIENQQLIDKRVREFNERKEEIQHELMLLNNMKVKQKVS